MNLDRALVSKAISSGEVVELIRRGVSNVHFTNTPDGQELAAVLEWATDHAKTYNESPSMGLFKQRWPDFAFEPSSDTVSALIDAFYANVKRRHFSSKVMELAQLEDDPSKWKDLDVFMLDAAKDLSAIVPSGRISRFSDMPDRIQTYEKERDNPDLRRTIKTNIPPFDEVTNGILPGNVVTVAGFSGRGKSLLSQFLLMNAYEQEATGLLMSLEMTAEEIFERLDTMVVNFSHKMLGRRELPEEQVDLWRKIARQFKGAKNDIIVVDRAMGCTTDRIYAEINRYKPDMAVVDYVQLMRSRQSYASQWQSLVDITNDLKEIALSTDCAIVMVSQDGRSSADDGSSEANMGGSVSVYQAADIYLGLHQNKEMYEQEKMQVRLLKNRRGGRTKDADLIWRPTHMDFHYPTEAERASMTSASDFVLN